jgi:hypothetical protein
LNLGEGLNRSKRLEEEGNGIAAQNQTAGSSFVNQHIGDCCLPINGPKLHHKILLGSKGSVFLVYILIQALFHLIQHLVGQNRKRRLFGASNQSDPKDVLRRWYAEKNHSVDRSRAT